MEIKPEIKTGIKAEVRRYVLESFAAGGFTVDDATPLITGGLIDSVGMISLVRFIEQRFGIEFRPKEIDAHRLDTIDAIVQAIQRKLETAP
jgi:acyl carrier protein